MTRSCTAVAPGRVNLIGDHTDYAGGRCLPFAIQLGTTATVTARDDRQVRATSTADAAPGWTRYVDGVVHELRRIGWPVPGLDVSVSTTLPLGGGLSSSAALECAVATAIAGLLGRQLDDRTRRTIAAACRRAETDHVGAPTGGMDQLVAMLGGSGHGLLLDFARQTAPRATAVPLDLGPAGLVLLVTDTGVRHRLADGDGGYAQRRRELAAGHPRRARHVRTENERVRAAVEAATADDWPHLGRLMTASHHSLRDDYEVSIAALDITVAAALTAGALGARMTGGGFGGCTVSLTHEDRVAAVRHGIDAAFAAAGLRPPTHHQVVPADGARLIT